jgi:tyrosyl-tRNA synthetase
LDLEERLQLITRNTLEIVTLEDLKARLETNDKLKGYLGFEPSGLAHVGWLVWMFKVKDLVEAGVDFIILEATWHAMINDKLGGNLELIRRAAYIVRVIMDSLGIGPNRVKFVDAEDLVSDKDYWGLLLRAAKNTTLARVKRALTIMGRKAEEAEMDFSKLIYPLMQVTDIFYMDLDIALGGMDQRKAHMLARDLAEKLKRKKPIAIHTPLISSLHGSKRMDVGSSEIDEVMAEVKMSKSRPETAIFVHDPPEVIRRKIRNAYCPPRQVEQNPIIEINKYILFSRPGFVLHVDRPSKYGGPVDYYSYTELERDYKEGKLHPLDLKNATAEALIKLLDPIRRRLEGDPKVVELINLVEKRVTR